MRRTHLVIAALLALFVAGCASIQTEPGPEARQALAPTGKLRVGLFDGNAVHVIRDSAFGEMRGVGHDLGRALAARLKVSFEPVLYSSFGPLLDGAKTGAWDVAFVGVDPERAKFLDFTGNHAEVDFGYLVPAGSRLSAIRYTDRPGVRIAVVERGTPDLFLTRALTGATLIRVPGIPGAIELLKSGQADVLAGLKPNMYAVSAQLPGSRVLDGRPGTEEQAMALPKGRGPAALAYARRFIEDAKATGLVQRAIDRARLRGVVVAPPA
jgi:polar amino acid transport system substrate-binding protein